jgi:hypothetical protein
MSGRKMTEQERVFRTIQARPGMSRKQVMWARVGGAFSVAGEATGEIRLTFAQAVKMSDVDKRIGDLSGKDKISQMNFVRGDGNTTAGFVARRSGQAPPAHGQVHPEQSDHPEREPRQQPPGAAGRKRCAECLDGLKRALEG